MENGERKQAHRFVNDGVCENYMAMITRVILMEKVLVKILLSVKQKLRFSLRLRSCVAESARDRDVRPKYVNVLIFIFLFILHNLNNITRTF